MVHLADVPLSGTAALGAFVTSCATGWRLLPEPGQVAPAAARGEGGEVPRRGALCGQHEGCCLKSGVYCRWRTCRSPRPRGDGRWKPNASLAKVPAACPCIVSAFGTAQSHLLLSVAAHRAGHRETQNPWRMRVTHGLHHYDTLCTSATVSYLRSMFQLVLSCHRQANIATPQRANPLTAAPGRVYFLQLLNNPTISLLSTSCYGREV